MRIHDETGCVTDWPPEGERGPAPDVTGGGGASEDRLRAASDVTGSHAARRRCSVPCARMGAGVLMAVLLVALLVFGAAGCGLQKNGTSSNTSSSSSFSSSSTTVAKDKAAPDFTFTRIDGTTGKLSDYRGQVVFLNFWATWCGYCVKEMPSMQQLAQNYPDVVILAVNRGETASVAQSFAAEKGYGFVWATDESGAIAKLYPSSGIPYSLFIDKEGIVRTLYKGSPSDPYTAFQSAVVALGA